MRVDLCTRPPVMPQQNKPQDRVATQAKASPCITLETEPRPLNSAQLEAPRPIVAQVLAHWSLKNGTKITLSHTQPEGLSASIQLPNHTTKTLNESQIRGFTGKSQTDKKHLARFIQTLKSPDTQLVAVLVKDNTELVLIPKLEAAGIRDGMPRLDRTFATSFENNIGKRRQYMGYAIAHFQDLQDTLVSQELNIDTLSNTRNGFLELSHCSDVRIQSLAMNELISSLESGPFGMEEVQGLVQLSKLLMADLEKTAVVEKPPLIQEKLVVAYGLVVENLLYHYAQGNFGKIDEGEKRDLVSQTKKLKGLIKKENTALKYALAYALEGTKRLETDRSDLKKWANIGVQLVKIAGGTALMATGIGAGIGEEGVISGLKGLYKEIMKMDRKRGWYEQVSMIKRLGRVARRQADSIPDLLTHIKVGVSGLRKNN